MYVTKRERLTIQILKETKEKDMVTIGERKGRYVGFYVASMHSPSPLLSCGPLPHYYFVIDLT